MIAIIALIVIPPLLNVIEKDQKGAFKDGIYGIIEASEIYVATNDFKYLVTFMYSNDSDKLEVKGMKQTLGMGILVL